MGRWAIADLGAPGGSRDIAYWSLEFGRDGLRRFVGFWPHFHLKVVLRTQSCRAVRVGVQYLGVFWSVCLGFCGMLDLGGGVLFGFGFCCCGSQNRSDCLLLKNERSIT